MTGTTGDELFVDVIARLDQQSFRQIAQEAERLGQSSGGSFGGGFTRAADGSLRDAQGRFVRELQTTEQNAAQAGERAGSGMAGAFSGGLAALPALAATAALAVGAAVTGAAVSAVGFAQEAQQGVLDIQAQLGVTAQEAEALGETAKRVFANNWGESLADAQAMLVEVRRQMKGLAAEDLESATNAAAALADTFQTDVGEQAQAANTLMQNFGLTSQEAFDFLAKGFQSGLNNSDDFLDTINEYSTQFKNGGASAEQFFSVLQTGAQGGALGTDKAADAFKEFVVRIQDGSKSTSDGLKALGIDSDALAKKMASGQVTSAEAFQLVLEKLRGVKDANLQMQTGVALLGTQFEDLGKSGALALDTTKVKMADLKGATDDVNKRYDNLGQLFQGVSRQILVQLEPVGKLLLDLANEAMPAVKAAVAQVGPAVQALARFIVEGFKEGRQVVSDFAPQVQRAVATFRPVVEAIGPLFQAAFTLVRTVWETVLRPVLTAIAPLFVGVVASVGNTLNLLVRTVTGVVNAVSAVLRGDLGGAVRALEGIFEEGVAFVVRQVRNMASTVLGLVKNLAPDMADAAANILRGMIQGIESGAGNVVEAARNMAGGVIKAVRDKLLMKSPSRVMRELGEFTAQGFVDGIVSKDKDVKAAATQTAQSFLTAFKELQSERAVGKIDLSTYLTTLEQVQARLKAQLGTVREGTPAYSAYLDALTKVSKELGTLASKSSDAQKAARAAADDLARNRAALEEGIAYEKWKAGLEGYSRAQLLSAAASERAAGNQQRYNDVLSEQKRRAQESAQAQRDFAAALAEGIQAGNAALDSLEGVNLGGRDLAATAQRLPETGRLFSELYARINVMRGELATPGVASAWAESLAELGRRGLLAAAQVDVLKGVLEDLQAAPVALLPDNLQGRGPQNLPGSDDPARGVLASGEADSLRSAMDALHLDEVGRVYADLILAGLQESDLGQLIAQYLLDQQNSINAALAEGGSVSINVETGAETFETDAVIRGIGVAAQDAGADFFDLSNVIENVLTMPWDEVSALLSASGLSADQVEKVAQAWRDFHSEATRISALDELLAPVSAELENVYTQLQAGTLAGADALAALNDVRVKLEGIGGDAAGNLVTFVDELIAGVQKGVDVTSAASAAWSENLNRIGFRAWVKGLKEMSDAQLQTALETARANENIAEFNALLSETEERASRINTLNLGGLADSFQKGRDGGTEAGVQSINNVAESFGKLASPMNLFAAILEKINPVGMILEGMFSVLAEPIRALQEPLKLVGTLVGSLIAPVLELLAPILRIVVNVFIAVYDALAALVKSVTLGFVDITRRDPTGKATSPVPTPPTRATAPATASGNNVVQIPSSQVTVMAAPEWVGVMTRVADKFESAVDRMAGSWDRGVKVNAEVKVASGSSSSNLAWELGTGGV